MAGIPHYYTLRKKWEDDEAFLKAAKAIRKQGVVRRFYSREQRYLDVNGFQYWTMDAKVRETTLINRQYCWHGAYWSRYDAAAQGYDSPWGGEWALQKEREAHYELAKVLFQMKRFAEAAQAADRAVTLDRSDYRIHYLLARIYTALGDTGKAEEHARNAVYVEQQ